MPIRTTGDSDNRSADSTFGKVRLLTVLLVHIDKFVAVPIGGQVVITFIQMTCSCQHRAWNFAERVEVNAFQIFEARI